MFFEKICLLFKITHLDWWWYFQLRILVDKNCLGEQRNCQGKPFLVVMSTVLYWKVNHIPNIINTHNQVSDRHSQKANKGRLNKISVTFKLGVTDIHLSSFVFFHWIHWLKTAKCRSWVIEMWDISNFLIRCGRHLPVKVSIFALNLFYLKLPNVGVDSLKCEAENWDIERRQLPLKRRETFYPFFLLNKLAVKLGIREGYISTKE